jgi:hypothetical protein
MLCENQHTGMVPIWGLWCAHVHAYILPNRPVLSWDVSDTVQFVHACVYYCR